MGAVRQLIGAGVRRRRLKGLAIGGVLFVATGAATLAFTVVTESQAPFDRAFVAANGAHLVVDYDATQTNVGAVGATSAATGVTGAAGPWLVGPVAMGRVVAGGPAGATKPGADKVAPSASDMSDPISPPAISAGPRIVMRLEARDTGTGPLDRMTIAGRWWSKPGEVVVSQDSARRLDLRLGDTVSLSAASIGKGGVGPTAPAGVERTATVVGIAGSVSTPALDGWLSPDDLIALTAANPTELEMLYRVASSATTSDLTAATAAITHDLPAASVLRAIPYLTNKARIDQTAALMAPILIGFSVFALGAAAFIVVNVIGGIVVAGGRDFGLLAAVGFTAGQIRAVLVGQIAVPATLGAILGLALGTIASQPLLDQAARGFGLPSGIHVAPEVIVGVGGIAFATVFLAALGSAWRIGRSGPIATLTRAAAPSSRVAGSRLGRAMAGSNLSPTLRLGLGRTVADPVRSLMVTGAVIVGVAAVVFGVGLDLSIRDAVSALTRDAASPVRIENLGTGRGVAVSTALSADARVAKFSAIGSDQVSVAGIGIVRFHAYQGDASWIGYAVVEGRWFSGPREIVVSDHLLNALGLHVGDPLTLTGDAGTEQATIVGTVFDEEQDAIRGDWAALSAISSTLAVDGYEILPSAGVTARDLAHGLIGSLGVAAFAQGDSSNDATFLLFEGVVTTLAIVLIGISLGGVLDTLLLETRERMRETAILKAVGMTPRQVIAMVFFSVVPIGIVGGLIGVPVGILLDHAVLGEMSRVATDGRMPGSMLDPLGPAVAVLGIAGLAIAVVGAWIPAGFAARAAIAPVLQAE